MDKKIFIVCQDNSWVNESIFYMYLNQILFKSSEINSNNKTMIVFDRARSHFSERINELFEKFNSKYSLIPPRQTSYVQPLDVSINHLNRLYIRNIPNFKLIIKIQKNQPEKILLT